MKESKVRHRRKKEENYGEIEKERGGTCEVEEYEERSGQVDGEYPQKTNEEEEEGGSSSRSDGWRKYRAEVVCRDDGKRIARSTSPSLDSG